MTSVDNSNFTNSTDIPESVRCLVEAILKVDIADIFDLYDEYEPSQGYDSVQMEVVEHVVWSLYKKGFSDALRFLKKGVLLRDYLAMNIKLFLSMMSGMLIL